MIQSPPSSPKKAGILIVLAASLLLNSVGIWYGLPSRFGWAPDEILPHVVQDGIAQRFSNDWFKKYPPLHYYLLALVETPLVIYAKLKGLGLDDISLNSCLILAHRLLSLIMAVGIVFLVYKCGREIFNERSSLFSAMIAALLVPLVYYAKTANLDVPYLFWFMSSLLFFLRLRKTRQRKYYLLFALSSILAICTKDQAYGLYILPPLVILTSDWKFRKRIDPSLTIIRFLNDKTYIYAAGVAVGAFFLIYNLAFNAQGFLHHIKLITGPISQDCKLVSHTISGHIYLLGRAWSQMRFSLGWPLFLICLAGVIRSLVSKPRNALLLSLFAFVVPYEVFFIHVILYNYSRYYLPLLLILSLFGGQFLAFVLEARSKFSTLFRVTAAALFIYSVFYAFSLDIFMIKDARYTAEKWIRQNIPKNATIGLAVWRVYAPRMEGYHSIRPIPFSLRKFQALSPKPDFIIVNTKFIQRYRPNPAGGRFFKKFYTGKEAYRVVFRRQTPLSWLPLKHREVMQQINTINPEIVIYKKLSRP
jgi:4-amino-4-deoxy-L-arabinose transferase-like glycosyltransferase